ncbi:MAG: (p)ppGpp synthetase [Clostridiales bacterium]|nr:(p)ppGpp synthetase [Clostridiales bacterium]
MYNMKDDDIERLVGALDGPIVSEIRRPIENKLQKCGIMYRLFSRVKSKESIRAKLSWKAEEYERDGKKLQDAIGFRIVLYFRDDIDICIKILNELFDVDNYEYDKPNSETFKPQRINYVFRIPDGIIGFPSNPNIRNIIDDTFEVQIRTIFSEGWHEVEHDVRYKYKSEWENEGFISRELNGILAVLEVCDNNILAICDDMAYKKYKEKDWESMLRHKFRLRLKNDPLADNIRQILNEAPDIAKELFRFDRGVFIDYLCSYSIPLNCNNIVCVANEFLSKNEQIRQISTNRIKETCARYIESKAVS